MAQLVVWNKTKYADALASVFGKENIVTNKVDFSEIILNWKKFKSIIILCELGWSFDKETVRLQRFSGIELGKELRRTHNVNLPIAFVSFYPLHKLFNAETEILTSIGHSYCQLPVNLKMLAEQLKSEEKLTPLELQDIQLFACNPRGIVMAKLHQISGIVNYVNIQNTEFISRQLERCIEEIHSVFGFNPDSSLGKFKREFLVIDKDNINKALRFIDETGKALIEKYTTSAIDIKITSPVDKPWKLLLLDDELNAQSELVKLLQEKGLEVICTSNSDDATKALTDDDSVRGKISLILSDYRLNCHQGEVLVQQRKQGYTFLQEIVGKFHHKLLSAIVYSGMPRQFLLETFKTFRIRTEIYSKIDFKLDDVGARNYLANRIIEIGDENYDALLALPLASKGWAEHLHDTYLAYRRQTDYEKRERDICDYCTDWVEKFRTGQNPPTPMIPGDAFNPRKNETEKNTLERFEAYYKTRRLAQFLNLYFESRRSGDPSDIIPPLLAPKKKKMNTPALRRGFFSQIIGFKREEFPFGTTIEELCWFEYDLGVKVLSNYKRYRNKLNEIENIIGEFIADLKSLKDNLTAAKFRYIDKRKHELIFDPKTLSPYLFDKTDLGVCLQWLNQQTKDFNGQALAGYLNLLNSISKYGNS